MVKPQEISNPRRILAVSLEESTEQLSRVIKDLTGTQPESSSSLAGTTHNLDLKTAYYTTTVPIWLDLVSDPSEWASSFLSEEAKEVLEVLGGVVVVFAIPPETASSSPSKDQTEALLKEVGKVVKDGLNGWEWDGVRLAVGVGEVGHLDDLDTWDEICGDAGLEFVHVASVAVSADAKNEFGEKLGIPRVLEALESNDWSSFSATSDDGLDLLSMEKPGHAEFDDDELDLEDMNFGFDREDFEGLKKAIWEAKMEREGLGDGVQPVEETAEGSGTAEADKEGDDDDIQKVEQMMRKLQAVRDLSAGLPEEQRKKMAAKAVGEVMRDL